MTLGGKRPGAGRPPGAKNKLTRQIEQAGKMAEVVSALVPDAFDGDAHAFCVMVYKDPSHPIELRLAAAGKALPYEKPALQSIDMNSRNEHVVHTVSERPIDREGEAWLSGTVPVQH